jgi:hypothetical protein
MGRMERSGDWGSGGEIGWEALVNSFGVGVAPALGESREQCLIGAFGSHSGGHRHMSAVSADDCHLMEETYRRYQLATFICNRGNVCSDTYMC